MLITLPVRNVRTTGLTTTVAYTRAAIEAGNVMSSLRSLLPLIDNADTIMAGEGQLVLTIRGYDDDIRELCEIPEIRKWFSDLTEQFPYWLHFCERHGKTLFFVLSTLAPVLIERRVSASHVAVRVDAEQAGFIIDNLLFQTAGLYEQVGIPLEEAVRLENVVRDSLHKIVS